MTALAHPPEAPASAPTPDAAPDRRPYVVPRVDDVDRMPAITGDLSIEFPDF